MGAWGYQMWENDAAWDAAYNMVHGNGRVRRDKAGHRCRSAPTLRVLSRRQLITHLLSARIADHDKRLGFLGCIHHLASIGHPIAFEPLVRETVMDAIACELQSDSLRAWDSARRRAKALEQFRTMYRAAAAYRLWK
jgi:hypothetical protein